MDKVDSTMNSLQENMEMANEIAEAMSSSTGVTLGIDEVCSSRAYSSLIITDFLKDELKEELESYQQEALNERLNEADNVPVHKPPVAERVEDGKLAVVTPYS